MLLSLKTSASDIISDKIENQSPAYAPEIRAECVKNTIYHTYSITKIIDESRSMMSCPRLSPCAQCLIKVKGGASNTTRLAADYQALRFYLTSTATIIKTRLIKTLAWLSIVGSSIC
jgi:hypothetical protein